MNKNIKLNAIVLLKSKVPKETIIDILNIDSDKLDEISKELHKNKWKKLQDLTKKDIENIKFLFKEKHYSVRKICLKLNISRETLNYLLDKYYPGERKIVIKFQPKILDTICEMYKKGIPSENIAKKFNVKKSRIDQILYSKKVRKNKYIHLTEKDIDAIKNLARNGYSISYISKKFKKHFSTIYRILKKE